MPEQIPSIGVSALVLPVQGPSEPRSNLRNGASCGAARRVATAQRIAAALLALTAVCMGAARYA